MYPVLFKLGFIEIYSYGFMVALAFLVSGFLLSRQSHILGVEKDFFWNLSFWVLLGGIAGGRLLYVLLNLSFFLGNPKELFMLWHGGLVWYGGFVGGFLSGVAYLSKYKLPILASLDLIAPYIALGQAIGRIGCLLNGCCYGLPVCWGLYFPGHGAYLMPTQIFSSLSLIAIFIILKVVYGRYRRQGVVFVFYMLLYSTKRFLMEFLRNDSPRSYFGLTIFQVLSLAVFILSLCFWLMLSKKPTR